MASAEPISFGKQLHQHPLAAPAIKHPAERVG